VENEHNELIIHGLVPASYVGIRIYPTIVSIPLNFAKFASSLVDAAFTFNLTSQGKVLDLIIGGQTFTRI
jgi:hypothetical protein